MSGVAPGAGPVAARRARPAIAGAFLGASLWVSAGVVAVVDGSSLARVGALPGWGWLAGAVLAGAASAAALPRLVSAVPLALAALVWLPWLPWPVPAALLAWDGPIEVGVWLAVVTTAAWPLVPTRRAGGLGPWQAAPRASIAVALLAAGVLTAAWAVARPRVPAGDEPHYLVITQSLLGDGDLRIENNHRQDDYLAYYDGVLRPDFMQRGLDRQIYSIHAPGVSAVVLPAFAVAGYPGAVATVIAIVAAGLGASWVAAWWLTQSAGAAWIAALALLGSAPFLLHGFTIYPDAVATAVMAVAILGLVGLETGRLAVTPRPWALVGAALAWLPWLHTRFAVLAAVLGLAVVARLWTHPAGRRAVAAFAVVPALAAAAWFTYFWRIYGTLSPLAPYGQQPEGGARFVPAGLVGLLVDQQFGVVATAPVVAVGLLGLWPLARQRPRLAVEITATIGVYATAVATYPMWWGGYSAPGRFLLAVLPPLALPLAALWAAGGVARASVGALAAVSALVSLAIVLPDRGAAIYNGRDGHAVVLDWASQTVDLTLGAPSVHRDGAATAAADAGIWGLAAVAVTGGWVLLRRRRAAAGWVGAWAAPAAALAALPVVWAGRERPVVTPPTSQMALLERWWPGVHDVAVTLTPTRLIPTGDLARRLSLGTSFRGHRAPGVSPLLQVPLVPAGDYDVFIDAWTRLDGVATVRLGRHDLPMASWALAERPPGYSGLALHLPVAAHSITVIGDEAARATVRRLVLRPRALPAFDGARRRAERAVRIGDVVLFALDDRAFLEPAAVWVRGETAARFVVQPDAAGPRAVRVQGGPVANTVTFSAGVWRAEVSLPAGETREVEVPAEALAPATLTVASASGFRPSEHDERSADVRWLGAYLVWR